MTSSTRLQGWDVNLGWEVFRSETSRLVVLGGFRSLDLLDTTTVATYNVKDVSGVAPGTDGSANLTFLGVKDTTGATYATEDRFRTSNMFYGGQLGARLTQELGKYLQHQRPGEAWFGCHRRDCDDQWLFEPDSSRSTGHYRPGGSIDQQYQHRPVLPEPVCVRP